FALPTKVRARRRLAPIAVVPAQQAHRFEPQRHGLLGIAPQLSGSGFPRLEQRRLKPWSDHQQARPYPRTGHWLVPSALASIWHSAEASPDYPIPPLMPSLILPPPLGLRPRPGH